MVSRVWLISDTHFGHPAPYDKFVDPATGVVGRSWASNVKEGDEFIRDMWAETIRPQDIVYHLGDAVVAGRRDALEHLAAMSSLPGRKRLLIGNHDPSPIKHRAAYEEVFEDVMSVKRLKAGAYLSHYPIHESSLMMRVKGGATIHARNIHGHTHHEVVRMENGEPNPHYLNVCVEKTGGLPILLEAALGRGASGRPDGIRTSVGGSPGAGSPERGEFSSGTSEGGGEAARRGMATVA